MKNKLISSSGSYSSSSSLSSSLSSLMNSGKRVCICFIISLLQRSLICFGFSWLLVFTLSGLPYRFETRSARVLVFFLPGHIGQIETLYRRPAHSSTSLLAVLEQKQHQHIVPLHTRLLVFLFIYFLTSRPLIS